MRGTGTTTQQLKAALPGSLFICNTNSILYHKCICERIGRSDITLVTIDALACPERYVGKKYSEVVVDHAVEDTPQRHMGLTLLVQNCTDFDKDRLSMHINIANHFSRQEKP